MSGNVVHTETFISARCQGRRERIASISGGRRADEGCGSRTEQRHREDKGQERARDTDPAELNRQHIAADSEHQEEQDELDRLPIPGLGGRESDQHRDGQHEQVNARDKRSTSCHGFVPHRSALGRSLGKTGVWGLTGVQHASRSSGSCAGCALGKVQRREGAPAPAGSEAIRTPACVVHGQRDRGQRGHRRAGRSRVRPHGRRSTDGCALPRRQVPSGADRAIPDCTTGSTRGSPHVAVALRRRGACVRRSSPGSPRRTSH